MNEQGFKRIPTEVEGRTVSDITTIIEDQEGFLWLGSDLGLLKYNGYEYIRYKNNPKDSTSLHDNSVQSLQVDYRGDIWVGTKTGVSRYSKACDCFFRYSSTPNNSMPNGFISDIIEDQNKNIGLP